QKEPQQPLPNRPNNDNKSTRYARTLTKVRAFLSIRSSAFAFHRPVLPLAATELHTTPVPQTTDDAPHEPPAFYPYPPPSHAICNTNFTRTPPVPSSPDCSATVRRHSVLSPPTPSSRKRKSIPERFRSTAAE